MTLRVNEIFFSIQGEGSRAGMPSIFVRLQGCSAKHACYASGVNCDTEFESGVEKSLEWILEWAKNNGNGCRFLVFTGGEPCDQLTDEIIDYFKKEGFAQSVETSGLKPAPKGLALLSISPKVAEHILEKNFPEYKKGAVKSVTLAPLELRYVRHSGQLAVPEPSLEANFYYLSPHFDGLNPNDSNIKHCIRLCEENPRWSLSVQTHKLYNVL